MTCRRICLTRFHTDSVISSQCKGNSVISSQCKGTMEPCSLLKRTPLPSVLKSGPLEITEIFPIMRLWVMTSTNRFEKAYDLSGEINRVFNVSTRKWKWLKSVSLFGMPAGLNLLYTTCTKACPMGHGKCKQLWYIDVCVRGEGRGRTEEEGQSRECETAMRNEIYFIVPALHDGIFKL